MRKRLRCRPAAQAVSFDKQGMTGLETGERTPFFALWDWRKQLRAG